MALNGAIPDYLITVETNSELFRGSFFGAKRIVKLAPFS